MFDERFSLNRCILDAGLASALMQTLGMRFLMPLIGERALIISAIALKGLVCSGMILAPANDSILTYFLLHSLSALFGVSMVTFRELTVILFFEEICCSKGFRSSHSSADFSPSASI